MPSDPTQSSGEVGGVLDLVLVVVTTVAILAVTLAQLSLPDALRIALGIAFVLFVPGYAFAAALFPAARHGVVSTGERSTVSRPTDTDAAIGTLTRVVLAFGLSLASVPLVVFVLNFTPWGISVGTALPALAAITLLCTAVAAVRRLRLPADARFGLHSRSLAAAGRQWLGDADTELEAALNVALVVGLVFALSGATFLVVTPTNGERYTEFAVQTQVPETGALVADDYPSEFRLGERKPVVVGVHNHEGRSQNYTVVVLLQEVRYTNESAGVTESSELGRFSQTVAANETWQRRHQVQPDKTGENLRVTYLLYTGEVPETVTTETAYRHVHFWIDVSESAAAENQTSVRAPSA